MTNNTEFCVTREKHLDHMTRVVPFIVTAYAVQCFFITKLGPVSFAVDGLIFMGVCLIGMIACFISYDLTHVVTFNEETITVKMKWLGYERQLNYKDITQVEVSESGVSFATVHLTMNNGKTFGFFFVDDADKIKAWIEKKRTPELQAAA